MVAPVLFFFSFASLQFIIVFLAYLSVIDAGRDAARWASVYPCDQVDSSLETLMASRLPPNLDSTKLKITLSPAYTVAGTCPRNRGDLLAVTLCYDVASLIFLPTEFGMGFGSLQILPSIDCAGQTGRYLPAYTMYVAVGPTE
jgi:hypothetical protein